MAVIGGGPAGVLTAAHFAKHGARVSVYEKRTASEQQAPRLGWTIALGDVATGAIEQAGLSADFGRSGLCAHPAIVVLYGETSCELICVRYFVL